MLIDWSDEYRLGIPAIDEQHRRLFAVLDDLHTAMKAGRSSETIGKILVDLTLYVGSHFQAEEQVMRDHAYPAYEEHKTAHNSYVTHVIDMKNAFNNKSLPTLALIRFLTEWIAGHVLQEDMKYREFVMQWFENEKGEGHDN